jgi:hypothetical protein
MDENQLVVKLDKYLACHVCNIMHSQHCDPIQCGVPGFALMEASTLQCGCWSLVNLLHGLHKWLDG